MPWCKWFQSSLNKFNITLKLCRIRVWWELYPPQGIRGLQLLFHSQAPTDTFHPGPLSARLPKRNLFHIARVCKPESAAHIAQLPQRLSAVCRGVKQLWLLKVADRFRLSYSVHRLCIMVTPDLRTHIISYISTWSHKECIFRQSDKTCNKSETETETLDLPLIITVMNGHCLLTGWHGTSWKCLLQPEGKYHRSTSHVLCQALWRPWHQSDWGPCQRRKVPQPEVQQVVILTVLWEGKILGFLSAGWL